MDTLLALVTHPLFLATLFGTLVPTLYRLLKELGLTVSGFAKTLTVITLSTAVAFIPLIVEWGTTGIPADVATIIGSIGAAFTASEFIYRSGKALSEQSTEVPVERAS